MLHEIKALLSYGIPKELDRTSLYEYFHLNYIPGPHSIFKNVTKLKPGSYLHIKGKEITEKSYYTIPFKTDEEIRSNSDSYEEAQKKS